MLWNWLGCKRSWKHRRQFEGHCLNSQNNFLGSLTQALEGSRSHSQVLSSMLSHLVL